MRASGTFTVTDFSAAPVPTPTITTGLPVGVATMAKEYAGDLVSAACG